MKIPKTKNCAFLNLTIRDLNRPSLRLCDNTLYIYLEEKEPIKLLRPKNKDRIGPLEPFSIERLDFNEDEQMINQEVIGNDISNYLPVLLEVTSDYCV